MLQGKTALITGSTSGIGLGIAEALAAQGANIVLNGFGDAAEIERLRADIAGKHGVKVAYDGADMTRGEAIERMMKSALGGSAASTCWSTTPASSMSPRSTSFRWRNGMRSSPSTCRPRSTPRASRCPP